MAWEQVAQAQVSSSGVQGDAWKTLDELPVGTEGLLHFHAPGIGPLMDAAGAEWLVKGVFWAKGVDIKVDSKEGCYGVGLNDGYIRFTGSPVPVLAILAAVALVLELLLYLGIVVAIALLIWKALTVLGKLIENPWTIVAIGTFVLGGLYLAGRRRG